MTLYESFQDIKDELYIMAIENYGINASMDGSDLWIDDGKYDIAFLSDQKLVGVVLPDCKTSYRLLEDGTCYKYNINTEKLTKITYNTFRKHFKNAVLSFERSIQEEDFRLLQQRLYG